MTEIVVDVLTISILHIEILISLGHRMNLRDMGNHMETFCDFTGMIYQNKSLIVYLRPLRSNTMQISSFGKELSAHGIGRDDNLCTFIDTQEMLQASGMIAMTVGNENIINIDEVYTQQLCVSNKHVTRSSVKQYLVLLCFQEDRKAMLCFKLRITRPII